MSRYISVNVDVDVDLDDIDTECLLDELKRRKKLDKRFIKEFVEHMEEDIEMRFDSSNAVLSHLRSVFQLKAFHGKDRIIKEIQDL